MNSRALHELITIALMAGSLGLYPTPSSAQSDTGQTPAPAAPSATTPPSGLPKSGQGPAPRPTEQQPHPIQEQEAVDPTTSPVAASTGESPPVTDTPTSSTSSAEGQESPEAKTDGAREAGAPPPHLASIIIDTALVDGALQGATQDLGLAVQQFLPAQTFTHGDYLAWEKRLQRPASGKIALGALVVPGVASWQLRLVVLNDKGLYYNCTASLDPTNVEVTTVRSLSQLAKQFSKERPRPSRKTPGTIVPVEDTSEGKATLAAAGALFGGYLGFAIENVGGSADAALIYPLVALGSGVGMATALIAAEEWPVSRPRAWYISGGGFWLTAAAVLIADNQELSHRTDRYPYGLIGTALGIGAASAVSSFKEVTEPQALLSNEGGAFGTLAGGLIQRLAAPSSAELPSLGMGIGGAAGWLVAGLVGPFTLSDLSSSRVLFAGLGGSVGALTGAAVASPAVVNADKREPKKEGVLFASALGGLVLGTVVGYWFGESDDTTAIPEPEAGSQRRSPATVRTHLRPVVTTTPEVLGASPYSPGLPSSTNLTLSGTW